MFAEQSVYNIVHEEVNNVSKNLTQYTDDEALLRIYIGPN